MMMRAIINSSSLTTPPLHPEPQTEFSEEGYHSNPNGSYEIDFTQEREGGWDDHIGRWIHLLPDENVVKAHPFELLRLKPTDRQYRVIIMDRDRDEVRRSHLRAFGTPVIEQDLVDLEMAADVLPNRFDVLSVTRIDYAAVIADPLSQFTLLRDVGWPIDPAKAAQVVDPSLYRNRLQSASPS